MFEFFEEIVEETQDFFEDLWEHLTRKRKKDLTGKRLVVVHGEEISVRPAYLFAERIENLLKVVFGISILLSAITASVLGFSSLSGLVEVLVSTLLGRLALFVIGFSYFLVGLWRILHLPTK